MKIIAFVGLPLSGKSTAAKVAEEMEIPVVVMGDVIREEVRKRGLELTDGNAGKIASELRQKEGMDAIAKRCIPRIWDAAKKSRIVVVDGIRGIAEVECFKQEFGDDFILIHIDSPIELRFKRALERKRSDDITSIEELRRRDERELSWNMGKAIEVANFTIENTSGLEDFVEKIKDILSKFAKQVEVEIETIVHPTEDEEKVVKAVKNLFPDANIRLDGGKLYAVSQNLSKLRELLRKQKILDTARTELLKNRLGSETTVYLNKQTAVVSRINFADEDAILSPLRVTFRVYGIPFEHFVDWLTPETRDGKPVKEIEL